jgi:hypothetical protein
MGSVLQTAAQRRDKHHTNDLKRLEAIGGTQMSLLRVLDHTGHRQLSWDPGAVAAGEAEARAAVAEAERIFADVRARGGSAFRMSQTPTRIDQFDPTADQILLVPRIIGG